jgi:hypothetical protein
MLLLRRGNMTMNEGKKFRVFPTKEQIKTLSQWIEHQRFIYNSKVGEDRYFRKFKNESLSLIGEDAPCDQKYSQFISADTDLIKNVPSQILRMAFTAGCRHISVFSKSFRVGLLSKEAWPTVGDDYQRTVYLLFGRS